MFFNQITKHTKQQTNKNFSVLETEHVSKDLMKLHKEQFSSKLRRVKEKPSLN